MTNGHGRIDACWVGCIDFRLRLGREEYLRGWELATVDSCLAAGGGLGLVSRAIDPHGELLRQLKTAAALHDPRRIILEAHLECGAVRIFLGKSFGSRDEERAFLAAELLKAREAIKAVLPGTEVLGVLATPSRDGVPAVFEKVF